MKKMLLLVVALALFESAYAYKITIYGRNEGTTTTTTTNPDGTTTTTTTVDCDNWDQIVCYTVETFGVTNQGELRVGPNQTLVAQGELISHSLSPHVVVFKN